VATVVFGFSAFAAPSDPIAHAEGAVITSIDCAPATHAPGAFDIIRISNSGAAQSLIGWQLTSDPEATERMALAVAGTLDPGEELIIVAGPHGTAFPADNIFSGRPSVSCAIRANQRISAAPGRFGRAGSSPPVRFRACPNGRTGGTGSAGGDLRSAEPTRVHSPEREHVEDSGGPRSGLPATGGRPGQESNSGQLALIAATWRRSQQATL
jgi:hypothetical protein